jgi:hypothetical protein
MQLYLKTTNFTIVSPCLACAIAAFLILGFNYFALYQLLPVVIFYIFYLKTFPKVKRSQTVSFVLYMLSKALLLLMPLTAQLMWYLDIGRLPSKSSTSAPLFLRLPIYAAVPEVTTCWIASITNRKS